MDYFTLSSSPPSLICNLFLSKTHRGAHPTLDVFVAPFLASTLKSITPSSSAIDYVDAVTSLILTASVSTLMSSIIIRLARNIKVRMDHTHTHNTQFSNPLFPAFLTPQLLRMGYYVPYPVVAGLLASVGVFFLRYSIMLEFHGMTAEDVARDMDTVKAVRLSLLLMFGLGMWGGGKMGKKATTPVVILVIIVLGNLLSLFGVIKEEYGVFWSYKELPPDTSLQVTPLTLYSKAVTGQVNLDAVYKGAWDVCIMTVMMVIR